MNHANFICGGEVIFAEHMTILDATIELLDNNSGHYKPQLEQTLSALVYLSNMTQSESIIFKDFGATKNTFKIEYLSTDCISLVPQGTFLFENQSVQGYAEVPIRCLSRFDSKSLTPEVLLTTTEELPTTAFTHLSNHLSLSLFSTSRVQSSRAEITQEKARSCFPSFVNF